MKNHWLRKFRSKQNEMIAGYYCPYVPLTQTPVVLEEVELNIEIDEIVAKTRKLKCQWSFEAQEDLRAFHGLELEKELANVLAKEITEEIDKEIIHSLYICL